MGKNSEVGLIGRKIGMTQMFDAAGAALGITVLEMGPNVVLQGKTTKGNDGYSALQLGYGTRKAFRVTKAETGHYKKAGEGVLPRYVHEIRVPDATVAANPVGTVLTVADVFKDGVRVDVTGNSKGRGFQGVMRRHNFKGFKRTHGVHEYHRHGGSIGTRLTPGMTFKGVGMPGHMGDCQVTVQKLLVHKIDVARNLLFIKGGVPGPDGANVVVRLAVKKCK
jgi:large subunit ribosomal protein L3